LREGLFIKKNKDRWQRAEGGGAADPDEMASDFIRLVDDLAYAKTYYPANKVTGYINSLASRIYLHIYRNRKEESNRIATFWKYDVPLAVTRRYRTLLFALAIFFLFFSIGFFSAMGEPHFVREVLGDAYVDLTEKNIAEGNPFDIYAQENSFIMWIRIMVNNIRVSFTYFFSGLALGVPSLLSLGKESIRIGAFEYMFYAKDLGGQAVITVLIHGMLELTAIIIACGAGAVLGTSFLFPGTQSRMHAFREGAKDAVKLIIALIPIFTIAAFFEGFVTRYYKMPLPLSLLILSGSTAFIVWYFVIYPARLYKQLKSKSSL
jgi:uncharacterized membrane protein SpoIIM required for sporulation